jgi:hypothetical protein
MFEICLQKQLELTVFRSAAQRNFRIYQQKQLKLTVFCFSHAAKTFGVCLEKQLKLTVFCSDAQRKSLEFVNKSNSN